MMNCWSFVVVDHGVDCQLLAGTLGRFFRRGTRRGRFVRVLADGSVGNLRFEFIEGHFGFFGGLSVSGGGFGVLGFSVPSFGVACISVLVTFLIGFVRAGWLQRVVNGDLAVDAPAALVIAAFDGRGQWAPNAWLNESLATTTEASPFCVPDSIDPDQR